MPGMELSLRERALRMLARREHARAELARKLAAYAASSEELEALLDELASHRLLSDQRYVEMRLGARAARYGNARLLQELRSAGVDDDLVRHGLSGVDDELARATAVWRRKYGQSGRPADAAEQARQAGFLMRRGFSGETVRRVLRGGDEG